MSTTTLTIAPAGTWQLDPVHSAVGFEVPYLGGTFKGQFRDVEATLAIEGDEIALTGAASVASVDVKDENLAAHLQAPDFFDVERHPELRFAAPEIELDGETVSVVGELTIKGITREVAAAGSATPALVDAYGRERLGVQLRATVDRTEFGLEWNVPLPTGEPALGNDVTIAADLFFTKAA